MADFFAPTIGAVTSNPVEQGQTTVIATVTPAVAGDTLTLTETAGAGTLSLGAVHNGTQQVIYTAPGSVPVSTTDAVSYTVAENGVSAAGAASVQLDAGPSVAPQTPSVMENSQTTIIGTVTPGLAGDTLTLTQAPGSLGTLSLGAVQANGTQQVIYTAPATVSASTVDNVAYTVADQHSDVVASGTASVQLDAGPSITAQSPSVVEKSQTTVIGTVTPGLASDTLTLTQAPGSLGTLSLGAVQANGTQQVIYTAPATVIASAVDKVAYTVADQHDDALASGSANVQLDAGPSIAAQSPSVVEKSQTTVIGTVAPGLAGDTLTLTQAPGSLGTLRLGAVQANGTQQVIYTAPATVSASAVDKVGYTVSDQHDDVAASDSANVQLDAGPSLKLCSPSSSTITTWA